jgi:hypothetical protein
MLGTGKTCSSIGIAEEMRMYLKQMGMKQRIIIVASPNVQDNYRLQLFNEKKLTLENGVWNIQSCVGNSLLKEINPTNVKGISREKMIKGVNKIINDYYVFMGYLEFANEITKKTGISLNTGILKKEQKILIQKNIKKYFNNRLIIIDEIHNIRINNELTKKNINETFVGDNENLAEDDKQNNKLAVKLFELAKHADNLRILLLSATPMYNSYKEIIWIVNLMNANDKRAKISSEQVFDKNGEFLKQVENEDGSLKQEGGRELLQRKLTGYVSYVRGENPYSFPYRIYPEHFSPAHTFSHTLAVENTTIPALFSYPSVRLNQLPLTEDMRMKYLQVYLSQIGSYQEKGYSFIIQQMNKTKKIATMEDNNDSFGYEELQYPIQALNILFPTPQFDTLTQLPDENEIKPLISNMVGSRGLSNVINHIDRSSSNQPERYDFEYKPDILKKYGRIFHPSKIGAYSNKIASICNTIQQSKGMIMIYSHYIDGGLVPLALALEEMGFSRYASSIKTYSPKTHLLKESIVKTIRPIDSITMKPKETNQQPFQQARYVMITGEKSFSINNNDDIKYITDEANKNGELVKVVLISKAAAEGLDFKNIRQVHILDPWYNINRIEQIIGRAVRNLSHCMLPFEERNVELYLHSTILKEKPEEETVDLYMYRLAEKKAIQIGKVSRLLKETAVDCMLNIQQTNMTVDKLQSLVANQNIQIQLSSGETIEYNIGDKPFSNTCDYMESCEFQCLPKTPATDVNDLIRETYSIDIVKVNNDHIMKKIKQLFRERYVYKQSQLISHINQVKIYPLEQIYYALSTFIENKHEYLVDKLGRFGTLVNRGEYYLFQPLELNDEKISVFERSTPIDFKHETVELEIPDKIQKQPLVELQQPQPNKKANVEDIEDEVDNNENPTALPTGVATQSFALLIQEIDTNLAIAVDTTIQYKEPQGRWNWYMHCSRMIPHLHDIHNIAITDIQIYIIHHLVDSLLFQQKMVLIQEMFSGSWEPKDKLEEIIYNYLNQHLLRFQDGKTSKICILLTRPVNENKEIYLNKTVFLVQDNNVWRKALPTELAESSFLKELKAQFYLTKQQMNLYVGYFSLFKANDSEMSFKIKNTSKKNDKGAFVGKNTPNKMKLSELLNSILNSNQYNMDNTSDISQVGMCVLLEMIMRHKTAVGKNKQNIMFLSNSLAYFNLSKEIK